MGNIVQLPARQQVKESTPSYAEKLQTKGDQWVFQEKKLLDRAEFLEAMILVLDDVRLQNIRSRDYSMMEIVSEEIPRYEERLETTKQALTTLRREYWAMRESVAN
ncbi:hypothetical protein GF373_09720 [bacterium]|nr:hypothetical protein [bacterium]